MTNPTHYSVAIMYDRFTMNAPYVSAKGKDEAAFRIREIAKENSVPVMENKPLARALYSEVDVGQEIPVKYWETVSIILYDRNEIYKGNEICLISETRSAAHCCRTETIFMLQSGFFLS